MHTAEECPDSKNAEKKIKQPQTRKKKALWYGVGGREVKKDGGYRHRQRGR